MEPAAAALEAGYGNRMMLEMSSGNSFGVLAPAFKGCEAAFATQRFADRGCTFLRENHCELHSTGYLPLEFSFCHRARRGMGLRCHVDVGPEWNMSDRRALIVRWSNRTDSWARPRDIQVK